MTGHVGLDEEPTAPKNKPIPFCPASVLVKALRELLYCELYTLN